MRNATIVTISTFGALAGLAGIEHGIGEALQGNRAPDGVMIVSWPGSELFRIVAGEPAMTIVTGFAYDLQPQINVHQTPAMSG